MMQSKIHYPDECSSCGKARNRKKNGKPIYNAMCRSCATKGVIRIHGLSQESVYHAWYSAKEQVDITLDEYTKLYDAKPEDAILKVIDNKLIYYTRADSSRLSRMRSDNSSGYTGVYKNKVRGYWVWEVCIHGKKTQGLKFDTPEDAGWARERWIIENDVIAKLNFLQAS